MKSIIKTQKAAAPIGPYSQAVCFGHVLYISGQIALHPETQTLVTDTFMAEATQVFENLAAVCKAGSGSLDDILNLRVYLTDLSNMTVVNELMARYFSEPYPARAALEVSALPRGARVEIEATMACRMAEE